MVFPRTTCVALCLLAAPLLAACESDPECSQSRCEGDVAVMCHDGVRIERPCPYGCSDGRCQKRSGCTEKATRCSADGVPQVCLGNAWKDLSPCKSPAVCHGGKCATPQTQKAGCDEGRTRCSSDGVPQKCVGGIWVFQKPCGELEFCKDGACAANTCGAARCAGDETCVNSVCVPSWQLSVANGAKCNPDTWVDYCSDANEVVSCSSQTGVYRDACTSQRPCTVGDFSAVMGSPWSPAFCNSPLVTLCYDTAAEIPYCTKDTAANPSFYFENTIQCGPSPSGGFLAVDYAEYYESTKCPNGCDTTQTACADAPACAEPETCDGDVLHTCRSDGTPYALNCAELDAVCRKFTYTRGYYANCFEASDACKQRGATKLSCDGSTLTTHTCLAADGDASGALYWAVTSRLHCAKGCNDAKTGCKN